MDIELVASEAGWSWSTTREGKEVKGKRSFETADEAIADCASNVGKDGARLTFTITKEMAAALAENNTDEPFFKEAYSLPSLETNTQPTSQTATN